MACFQEHVPGGGQAEGWNLQDESRAFSRHHERAQSSRRKEHGAQAAEPNGEGGQRQPAQHSHDHPELGRARHRQGEEERGDEPVAPRLQNARRQDRHGAAAEAENHGEHGLAAQAHELEDPVYHDGQARQIAGILQDAEGEEERGGDGQNDGEGVREGHGDDPVRPHEHVAQELGGHEQLDGAG